MLEFLNLTNLIIIDIEVSEKIESKNLKNFLSTTLKLKNINLKSKEKILFNYIEELKEYQIIIAKSDFLYFEFQVFDEFLKDKNQNLYQVVFCQNFFCIYKGLEFYYIQKLEADISKDDLLEFLNKRFNIQIDEHFEFNKVELENLKKNFLESKEKKSLKYFNYKKDYEFFIYIFYTFLLIVLFFIYKDLYEIKENSAIANEVIDMKIIEKKFEFKSFEKELKEITNKIQDLNLEILQIQFNQNILKLQIVSNNKDDIYKFLEDKNIIFLSSKIDFLEDRNFKADIDVQIFE